MRKTTASASETDEVDQLLQAAHDDVLLKLSLNSHIARGASDSLDSDLSRRFQALKSRPSAPKPSPPPQTQKFAPPPQVDDELKAVLGDDLSARFAALRGSINPSSSSGTTSSSTVLPGDIRDQDGRYDDEEDEVEKIIRWAKDAARLDPSPPSDEEAGDNDDDDEEEEDTDGENNSDDDESTVDKKKANRTMSRPSQSQRRPKWFPRSRNR